MYDLYDWWDVYLFTSPENPKLIRDALENRGLTLPLQDEYLKGYLGFKLDFLEVTATHYLFQLGRATGMSVPLIYRDNEPKVSKEEAAKIAEPFLWGEVRRNNSEYHFDPPFLSREHPMWYVFTIKSEFIPKRGYCLFFAFVDVLDGHIWEPEEEKYFYYPFSERMYRLRSGQDKP
jgi:hypothetical protein